MFDVTNRESFDSVEGWLSEAKEAHGDDTYVYILVGNKCDLSRDRVVSSEEAQEYATRNEMKYIETSAVTGANVTRVFDLLVDEIMTSIEEGRVRMNRPSWDGVREGQVVTQSMLTSTHTANVTLDDTIDMPASSDNEVAASSESKRCHC